MNFICDVMLGKLAKYLRILGFDTIYIKNARAIEDYKRLKSERLFLTRRTKETGYERTVHIKSEVPLEQLREIKGLIRPHVKSGAVLNRCIECNNELVDVDKKDIEPLVPEFVFHTYVRFRMCPSCKRIYWEGSHTTGMAAMVKEVME